MDRRTSIKWVLAVSAAWPLQQLRLAQAQSAVATAAGGGYGTDPDLLKSYRPGEFWPLTLSAPQRHLAGVLADLIIPADGRSPSASQVGAVDFIDEWVSAPYPLNQRDRPVVLAGFAWLDAESGRRHQRGFAELDGQGQTAICDDICDVGRAAAERAEAARFFARFRDLTAAGFYSTPVGRNDLGYIGNVGRSEFPPPPQDLLKKLNLS